MAWLKKWWKWIAGAAIVILGAVIAAVLEAQGKKKEAAIARADTAEKYLGRTIKEKEAELAELMKDANKNAGQIQKKEAELAKTKEKLNAKFERQGLSAEETVERFRRIRL